VSVGPLPDRSPGLAGDCDLPRLSSRIPAYYAIFTYAVLAYTFLCRVQREDHRPPGTGGSPMARPPGVAGIAGGEAANVLGLGSAPDRRPAGGVGGRHVRAPKLAVLAKLYGATMDEMVDPFTEQEESCQLRENVNLDHPAAEAAALASNVRGLVRPRPVVVTTKPKITRKSVFDRAGSMS
jgi:hypothetical protein